MTKSVRGFEVMGTPSWRAESGFNVPSTEVTGDPEQKARCATDSRPCSQPALRGHVANETGEDWVPLRTSELLSLTRATPAVPRSARRGRRGTEHHARHRECDGRRTASTQIGRASCRVRV